MHDKITVRNLERWAKDAAQEGRNLYVWDTALRGFGAYVSGKGTVSWLFQVYIGGRRGKQKRITLGRYPDLDLEDARKEAEAHRKLFNDGALPESARANRLALERKQLAAPRLSECIDLYVKQNGKPGRYWPELHRTMYRELVEPLGKDIAVSAVTKAMLRNIIDAKREKHQASARLLYAQARPFFNWCLERELIPVSPLQGMSQPKPVKARDRVLIDAELKVIWSALSQLGWPWGPYHKVLMLTAQRREETAGMRWSELDLQRSEWTIPKERTKNGKEHLVHLSPQCIAVLAEIPRKNMGASGPSDLVFTTTGLTSIQGYSHAKELIDALTTSLKPWRVHDFRRTAASGMAALGHQPHVIERVLNHISGAQGGLVGVYQRHQYVAERKQALLDWGKHVESTCFR